MPIIPLIGIKKITTLIWKRKTRSIRRLNNFGLHRARVGMETLLFQHTAKQSNLSGVLLFFLFKLYHGEQAPRWTPVLTIDSKTSVERTHGHFTKIMLTTIPWCLALKRVPHLAIKTTDSLRCKGQSHIRGCGDNHNWLYLSVFGSCEIELPTSGD